MQDYKRASRRNKRIFSRTSLIAFGLVALFVCYSGIKLYIKRHDASEVSQEARKRVSELEEKKRRLTIDIERLQSAVGAEMEIRKNLDMALPGEKVLLIVDKKTEEGQNEGAESGGVIRIWEKIKELF